MIENNQKSDIDNKQTFKGSITSPSISLCKSTSNLNFKYYF